MKRIKVGFKLRDEVNPKQTWVYHILSDRYDVEISKDPDYIICECYDKTMEDLNYNGIRILITGENFVPDFNLVDYAISPYPIQFFDRSFRFPQCASGYTGNRTELEKRENFFDKDCLSKKKRFANFIYSHESENGIRGGFFKELSRYKKVDSAGKYLNNMPGGKTISMEDGAKAKFQKHYKFSLSFENNAHKGYVTEKITDAFYAQTIPVYYGDPHVTDIFNHKAFINCNDYKSFEDVIKRIQWLDTHDEEYIKMINEPVFRDKEYLSKLKKGYEEFIIHIFEQPYEAAYRRSRFGFPRVYNDYYRRMGNAVRPIERTKIFQKALKVTYGLRHPKNELRL